MMIYVIGSLRNPKVAAVGSALRERGFEVFDDWLAAGPDADECWQRYEQARGRTYRQALNGLAARHVFHFDKYHLNLCDAAVLVAPAGKSAHLELGYIIGQGKRGFIYMEDEPERWDVMTLFANRVVGSIAELAHELGGLAAGSGRV